MPMHSQRADRAIALSPEQGLPSAADPARTGERFATSSPKIMVAKPARGALTRCRAGEWWPSGAKARDRLVHRT